MKIVRGAVFGVGLKAAQILGIGFIWFCKRFCKKNRGLKFSPLCTRSRGRTGTTLLSLVFETNASTDSAIRANRSLHANRDCKCIKNSPNQKFWAEFIRFQGRSPRKPAAPTSVRTARQHPRTRLRTARARRCPARPGTTQYNPTQLSTTRHDLARLSTTHHCPALSGTTQHNSVQPSTARQTQRAPVRPVTARDGRRHGFSAPWRCPPAPSARRCWPPGPSPPNGNGQAASRRSSRPPRRFARARCG